MTDTGMKEALRREAGKAEVVVFRSGLTDTRELDEWLTAAGVAHAFVDMPMGEAGERARFHALRELTGWPMLPMVFHRGDFVGGERELRVHLAQADATRAGTPWPDVAQAWLRGLGYGGLIPFVAGALALAAWPGAEGLLLPALLGYAAVILSFLGAVHWGRVLAAPGRSDAVNLLAWGVTPSVLAWCALLLPAGYGLAVFILLFVLALVVDHRLLGAGHSAYLALRRRLTAVVAGVLAAVWLLVG
ncbi:MAG: DUF3429 family protein [Gammaproteobacteria bacterium]|nr:DUF3429 family protein [Gammaproteobacteria bacterium]